MTYQTQEIVAHATRLYQAGMEKDLKHFIQQQAVTAKAPEVLP
ncbi:hypothetical protein [Psychrobacter lutiphocae]|nr:hypothetical protein [Psychrobacter lutiphocae]